MSANPPDKMRYRHEAIADMMLANPMANQNEIAEKLGYTPSWLSTVINSDSFKAYYEERRAEWNSELADTAHRKALEVGIHALDKTMEGLDAGEIDPVSAFDKALQRAGMAPSSRDSGSTQNNTQVNNYYTATPGELEEARARMRPQPPETQGSDVPAIEQDENNGEGGG